LARAAYRSRQVFHALFPKLDAEHLEQAKSVLGEGEMQLFLSMEKRDQRHGLRVLHHLLADGENDRDLQAAALIHDCGKGKVPVWMRVAYVVAPWSMGAFAGPLPEQGSDAYGWRLSLSKRLGINLGGEGAAYRLLHHARLGAELAQAAGSSAATVRFIAGRAAEHERDKIAMLRAADDRS
jgi:hypothetical protein